MPLPRWLRPLAVLAAGALCASAWAGGSTLYHNARFVTLEGRGSVARALLVRAGRVAAVGELADLARRPDAVGAERVDLAGGTVLPGLQDGHVDLGAMAEAIVGLDFSRTRSFEELILQVEARAMTLPEGAWITGIGWDETSWAEHAFPHHLLLSARVPRHAVFLLRREGRVALVNQAALDRAGLAGPVELTSRSIGGHILENAEGLPTGILIDGAVELVRKLVPPPDTELLAAALLRVQEALLQKGLTAVHDLGTRSWTLAALRALHARGKLTLRVACYLDGNAEFSESDGFAAALSASIPGQDTLTVTGVRLCLDGSLGLGGAALLEPYLQPKDERGLLLLTEDQLSLRISKIVQQKLQPVLEAHGDRANRLALDLLERVAAVQGDVGALRPRLESALFVATRDWDRVTALPIAVSTQPLAVVENIEAWNVMIGSARTRSVLTWLELGPCLGRNTAGGGTPVWLGRTVLGSGAPVFSFDPLAGLAALTRPGRLFPQGGDGAAVSVTPTADEVLACYTSGAAWACRQENRRGRMKPGFAADFTVFASDPLLAGTAPVVRLVVIDGNVVWRLR